MNERTLTSVPSLAPATHHKTSAALMDAAERLFAQRGIDAVSIRDIAREAGANLGAVNYHFESKDKLVLAVFARRLEPLHRERMALLEALEARRKAPTLEELLELLIRPAVMDAASGKGRAEDFIRVIARSAHQPSQELKEFFEKHLEPFIQRFDAALMRAAPGLTREEIFWRMPLVMGALHHALDCWAGRKHMPRPPWLDEKKLRIDQEGFIARFIEFAAAGLRAAARSAKT